MPQTLFHLIDQGTWQQVRQQDFYRPASLQAEGFVHCSRHGQLADTANRYFSGRHDLLILHIDTEKVDAPVVVESTTSRAETYPHIYGPVPLAAVQRATPFQPNDEGLFSAPEFDA